MGRWSRSADGPTRPENPRGVRRMRAQGALTASTSLDGLAVARHLVRVSPFRLLAATVLVGLACVSAAAAANTPPRITKLELHSISGKFDGTADVDFTIRLCDATKGRFRVYLTQQRMLNGTWQTRRSSFPLVQHYGGCFVYGFDRPAAWNPTTARMDRFRIKVQVRDTLGALSNVRTAEIFADD